MRSSRRRQGPIAALAGLLVGALAATASQASGPQDAEDIVRNAAIQVVTTVNQNRAAFDAEPERFEQLIGTLVLPHFDFERMSQRVLGKHWPRASETQRRRFAAEFESLLIRTYIAAMRDHATQTPQFLPLRVNPEGTLATVRTTMDVGGGAVVPINYEMYVSDAGWKVYDVSIDGVSLVINYRSSFSEEIRAGGIDGLIDRLSRHNDDKAA